MAVSTGSSNQYHRASWRVREGEAAGASVQSPWKLKPGAGFAPLVASLVWPPPLRDETLQNPRCVFQIVKRHFARYTPEMVEKTTGCPKETFLKVAETILANSGADRTTSFAYAVAWTQHTYGVQIIGACALLQLLLGNIGRPGRRRHGAPRPRLDSGLDGYSDALPFDPGLYGGADGAQEARHAAGLHRHRDDTTGLLGEPAEIHGFLS